MNFLDYPIYVTEQKISCDPPILRFSCADIHGPISEGSWKTDGKRNLVYARSKRNKNGESFGWKRAEFAEANCSIRILSMMHPRSRGKEIERKKGYPETNYARESWESFGFFEPRESWRGENRGWRLASGSSWIGRRMMMGRICAMSNDIKKIIWLVLYTRMVYRFNLRSNFFHDKLKNWKKKFQRTKIYLRVYSYDCIFDVDITVIIVRFAYV